MQQEHTFMELFLSPRVRHVQGIKRRLLCVCLVLSISARTSTKPNNADLNLPLPPLLSSVRSTIRLGTSQPFNMGLHTLLFCAGAPIPLASSETLPGSLSPTREGPHDDRYRKASLAAYRSA